jgi:hypothetical protein
VGKKTAFTFGFDGICFAADYDATTFTRTTFFGNTEAGVLDL